MKDLEESLQKLEKEGLEMNHFESATAVYRFQVQGESDKFVNILVPNLIAEAKNEDIVGFGQALASLVGEGYLYVGAYREVVEAIVEEKL